MKRLVPGIEWAGCINAKDGEDHWVCNRCEWKAPAPKEEPSAATEGV